MIAVLTFRCQHSPSAIQREIYGTSCSLHKLSALFFSYVTSLKCIKVENAKQNANKNTKRQKNARNNGPGIEKQMRLLWWKATIRVVLMYKHSRPF